MAPNKEKLITAWIEIHKEDLEADWKLLQSQWPDGQDIGPDDLYYNSIPVSV